jgi:hypothetical protein
MSAFEFPSLLVLLAHGVSAFIILQTLCYICGGQIGKESKTVNSCVALLRVNH